MIKATRVDGIYESDPEENPNAKMYDSISFDEVINKKLRIMDATALLCVETETTSPGNKNHETRST